MVMLASVVPSSSYATIANWEDTNIVYDSETFGTNGYYNVISKKDYVLVPGAAVESEMVLNNAAGTRRQVLHIIEVDPSNPDVSIVPGYYQIDKDLEDEANWSHKELTEMAKYYENTLGYNIVGGMNTDLYYNSYSPRVLVYNGKWIGNAHENVATGGAMFNPTSSILYVFKDAEGNVSCDVKAYVKSEFEAHLASGRLQHAVSVSFAMVVKDGKLVNTKVSRGSDDAARSMVGIKEDGSIVMMMCDGRQDPYANGFTVYEAAEFMLSLGCVNVIRGDGGGSSQFYSQRPGEEMDLHCSPSDGAVRPTTHGILVLTTAPATGEFERATVSTENDYYTPGSSVQFNAVGSDAVGTPADIPAEAYWTLTDATMGSIDSKGVFVSNGIAETITCGIIATAVSKALLVFIKKKN
jgi:uncharacterized protein YigE (DUF2233 family)